MQPTPSEHVLKLAERIKEDSKQAASPVPKMKIPKLFDLETGLGIGDIMTILPVLPGLQELYPDFDIRVISEKPDWASLGHDYVVHLKDVEMLGTRGERYFKQIEGNWIDSDMEAIANKELRHEMYARRVGVRPQKFKVRLRNDTLYWAKQILDNRNNLKVIGISPYATSPQRTWADENWVRLTEYLVKDGHMPIMFGGRGEGDRSKYYPCMRFWGLDAHRTAALVKQCNLMIGNDSGISHVAATLDVPTIVLGAPTDTPRIFGWYGNVSCIQAKGECSMCYWNRARGFRQECNYRCRLLNTISAEEVFAEAKRLLKLNDGKPNNP